MVLRLSSAPARLTFVFVALILATTLAYSSVRNALAVYYAGLATRAGYERAVQLEPRNAENWFLLGRYFQYNLEDPDAQRAINAYRASLSLDPRAAVVWLDLATAYESQGDLPAAREAFLQAKRVYPVSAEVSWRYGNFLLRQSELPAAFAEIRHAVSADPKRAAEAFSRCWRVDPDIQAILDHALPPSAPVYLDAIRELDADAAIDPALAVWDRLASLHPQLPLAKVIPFTDSLIQAHRLDGAHRVWDQAVTLADSPPSTDPPGSVLWDGGFETGVLGGGFAWTIAPRSPGVQVTIDSNEKHSGRRSLRLGFDGSRNVDFSDVCHVVQVQPGTAYRFSGWVLAQNLATDQGIRFRLEWLANSHNASAETTEVHGTQPWTELSLPWTAAAGIRQLRVCVTRHPSDDFGSRIHGTAWVDDVALVPESSSGVKP
jgi:tetratricopeptide (TPR) repeat protein